jgi:hypothetical protein
MTATLPDDVLPLIATRCCKPGFNIIKSEVSLPKGISDITIEDVREKDLEARTLQVLREFIQKKEIKRIIVSCSGSASMATKLKKIVDENLVKNANIETFLVKSAKDGQDSEEAANRQKAISKLQSKRCANDPIIIVFTTSILSSGIDCDVDAILSVGGTFSVAECFQLLGRLCRKPGSKGIARILYCSEFWEKHFEPNGSDEELYKKLENCFEVSVDPLKKFLGCASFKHLMMMISQGNCFINTLNGLMNANENLFKEKCGGVCSCCRVAETPGDKMEICNGKKKVQRSRADLDTPSTNKRGRKSCEQVVEVNKETDVVNFYKNKLRAQISMSKIECFVCKTPTAGVKHYPNNCNKLRNLVFLKKKDSCGQCCGDKQHKLDDTVNCLQLETKTSPICVVCFRNKDECRTESCSIKPIWKSSRHVLMFVYHTNEIFSGLKKSFPTFERALNFKQFFEICTKEQFGPQTARFPRYICVLYYVLCEKKIFTF